jgi:hypothetical protein
MTAVHTLRRVRGRGVLAVALLLICSFLAASPAAAQQSFAIFIVDSAADWPDAHPADGNCAALMPKPWLPPRCTLRAAIDEVNAGSQTNTISLPAGTYLLTSQLVIRKEVHLWGAGADRSVIDAKHLYRVFDIASGALADISGVMIQNGVAEKSIVVPSHYHGGAIHNHGTLMLRNSAISGSVANNSQPYGGGIYNAGSANLANVTISYNSATMGGGIYDSGGAVLNNVTISGNLAGQGGGIYSAAIQTLLTNSIVADNDALPSGLNCFVAPTGTVVDGGFNLQHALTASNSISCGTIITVADPQLQPVVNSNGSAIYFLLPRGSAAIDLGNPAAPNGQGGACAADDQRFVARPQDGDRIAGAWCDIGAYERRPTDP